jgi:hypothetical protein
MTIEETVVIPMALRGIMSLSSAIELNPAVVKYTLPDQIQWSAPDERGVQNAVMVGDPTISAGRTSIPSP